MWGELGCEGARAGRLARQARQRVDISVVVVGGCDERRFIKPRSSSSSAAVGELVAGLAGRIRSFAVRWCEGSRRRRRRRRIGARVMAWWQKVVFPVRRAWCAVAARIKARKEGGGILMLHDDVQTCGYEDVQVMWEMLRRSETELSRAIKRKPRQLWRATSPVCPPGPNHNSLKL